MEDRALSSSSEPTFLLCHGGLDEDVVCESLVEIKCRNSSKIVDMRLF